MTRRQRPTSAPSAPAKKPLSAVTLFYRRRNIGTRPGVRNQKTATRRRRRRRRCCVFIMRSTTSANIYIHNIYAQPCSISLRSESKQLICSNIDRRGERRMIGFAYISSRASHGMNDPYHAWLAGGGAAHTKYLSAIECPPSIHRLWRVDFVAQKTQTNTISRNILVVQVDNHFGRPASVWVVWVLLGGCARAARSPGE